MNRGVEILLKRMDSNPEEFEDNLDPYRDDRNKWSSIIHQIKSRMEVIDRDNGNAPYDGEPRVRAITHTKPLPYLTDEEVTALHTKLVEVQGVVFTKRIMSTLLKGEDYPDLNEESLTTTAMNFPYGTKKMTATKIVSPPQMAAKAQAILNRAFASATDGDGLALASTTHPTDDSCE